MISKTFLPVKFADIIDYAEQVKGVVTATGFTPASIGLTSDLVTALTTALTDAESDNAAVNAAVTSKQAATEKLSGPSGSMAALINVLRDIANAARISSASDDEIAQIGVSRRNATPTPVNAPTDAPEFSLDSIVPGRVNVRFRTAGSAAPRARHPGAAGAQIAVVNASAPAVDGEADNSPNIFVSRSPASLDSTSWPVHVRLYARWLTGTGKFGPWSTAINVSVA